MRHIKIFFLVAPLLLISCQSANVSPITPAFVDAQSRGMSPDIAQGGSGSQWVTVEPLDCCASDLVAGSHSTVWYLDELNNSVGRIDMAHIVTLYPLPALVTRPTMTAGSDGNMWVIDGGDNNLRMIVKVTPSGKRYIFHARCATGKFQFTGIAGGPDGNVWFGINANMIGRITPAGDSTCYPTTANTYAVAAGPDGNVWFTESGGPTGILLGKITPSGTVTEFAETNSCIQGFIAVGDGYLYGGCTNGIVRVSPSDGSETIISPVHVVRNLATSGTGSNARLYYAVTPNHLKTLRLATGFSHDDDAPLGQTEYVAYGADGNLWYYSRFGVIGVDVFRILTVSPTSMNLAVGQSQSATSSERDHPASSLVGQSSNPQVASVAKGPSPGEFNVTGQAAGSTIVRVGDNVHNYVDIAVTVH